MDDVALVNVVDIEPRAIYLFYHGEGGSIRNCCWHLRSQRNSGEYEFHGDRYGQCHGCRPAFLGSNRVTCGIQFYEAGQRRHQRQRDEWRLTRIRGERYIYVDHANERNNKAIGKHRIEWCSNLEL